MTTRGHGRGIRWGMALVVLSTPTSPAMAQTVISLGYDVGWVRGRFPRWTTDFGRDGGDGAQVRVVVAPEEPWSLALEVHGWSENGLSRGALLAQVARVVARPCGCVCARFGVFGGVGYGRVHIDSRTSLSGPLLGAGVEGTLHVEEIRPFGIRASLAAYLQGLPAGNPGGHHSYTVFNVGASFRWSDLRTRRP